ncbi:MAG: hypothetical protein ACJ74O_09950 [Frankiaceae bacterium]
MSEPGGDRPDEAGDELVGVRLLEVPVALWARSAEHGDELMREFTLVAAAQQAGSEHEVPARLVSLVEELTASYGAFSAGPEERLAKAAADGLDSVDLWYEIPRAVGPAAQHLGELLDQADEYCRSGRHLLTLATPPDQCALRWWYLGQFIDQIAGGPPVPWPQWRRDTAS